MHIAFIGGAGSVGRETLSAFTNCYERRSQEPLAISVVTRPGREDTARNCIDQVIEAHYTSDRAPFSAIQLQATSDYSTLTDVDLFVVLANNSKMSSERLGVSIGGGALNEIGLDGFEHRDTLSFHNFRLVSNICEDIKDISESDVRRDIYNKLNPPQVVMVTNQVNHMSALAREILPPETVLGFGGMLDSIRFRSHLGQVVQGRDAVKIDNVLTKINDCQIVGYHNRDMFLLRSSASELCKRIPNVVQDVLEEIRGRGLQQAICQTNVFDIEGKLQTPYLVPGRALATFLGAYVGVIRPIKESFDVALDEESVRRFGVEVGTNLSVPVDVYKGGYKISEFTVDKSERHRFREIVRHMNSQYEVLKGFCRTSGQQSTSLPPEPSYCL